MTTKLGRQLAAAGFTLVELVVVIVLVGVLSIVGANIIGNFVGGYTESAERARLAGVGRVAIERMTREIRHAVPNSIRTDLGTYEQLTFLNAPLGGLYVAVGAAESRLDPGKTGDRFVAYGLSGLSANNQLVVYPLTADSLYSDLGKTDSNTRARLSNAGGNQGYSARTVELEPGDSFVTHSPNRRVLGLEGVKAFCYLADAQELRMAVHSPLGDQPTLTTNCGPSSALLAAPVTSASFTYDEGSLSRSGLVRIYLELTSPESGESVDFQQEVHVRNVP